MRALFIQISGILGLLTFLNYLWNNAAVEQTLFMSFAVGFAVYFVLVIGDNVIQKILSHAAPAAPEDAKVKNETINAGGASTKETAKA